MSEARDPGELLRLLDEGLISRRTLLRSLGIGSALAVGGGVLSACGATGSKAKPADKPAKDLSATEKVLVWSNWPLYIDVDEKTKKHPTLEAFEAKTGLKVTYTEDVNDNDEFYGKIRPPLSAGKSIGRDIVVLTDWMAARMIRLKYVQKLDKKQIPNAKNVRSALQHPGFDKNRDYTLPWQSGLTGISYNPKATAGKPVETIDALLTDKALKGRVTVLTEMRDTIGLVMLAQGKDPAKFSDSDYENAINMLDKAVKDGQIRKFTGNDYAEGLASGNIAACIAWSGDVIQLQADNPDIKFVTPESGAMLWSDNMMIPNGSVHQKNAEMAMDYYYDPKVAAQVAAYVNYICPVEGAKEEMASIDKSLVDNPLIFPDDATLSKTHIFKGLNADQEKKYTDMFTKVSGA